MVNCTRYLNIFAIITPSFSKLRSKFIQLFIFICYIKFIHSKLNTKIKIYCFESYIYLRFPRPRFPFFFLRAHKVLQYFCSILAERFIMNNIMDSCWCLRSSSSFSSINCAYKFSCGSQIVFFHSSNSAFCLLRAVSME